MSAPSPEGPWRRARPFAAALTKGSSDASSVAWGGCREHDLGHLPRGGGVFPPDWLSNHINQKERYGLHHILRHFFTRQPELAAARQVFIDVDNPAVVSAFNRRRAMHRETQTFPVQLFEPLDVVEWIPTAENEGMDAISRPSRKAIIRIAPASVQAVWDEIGPFKVDLCWHARRRCCDPHSRGDPTCWCATFRSFRVP